MSVEGTIKVLLLEDDSVDYRIIAEQLHGHQRRFIIEWVKTLAEAVEMLGRRTFNVVLTDLSVPDSEGLETVSRIKDRCGAAPVIALTGTGNENVERDTLAVGAQDYLVKGELGGRAVSRAILHALQRQQAVNEVNALMQEQERSHLLLEQQAELLKKKNRRLRRLYKTAQDFVDNVSHDFRTPLTVIKDYVSIVREGMAGEINDEQQTLLDKVAVRADDLNMMVDDLLDVSKLESGLLGAWRRNVEVQEIVQRAESLLRQRALAKNVDLTIECRSGLPDVYCDPEKVGRIITNLAVNAIKFAGERGTVRLWAESDPAGHQVLISISDNGPGIDKQSLNQIFKRFRQLNSHIKSTVKGFGLGLNIAQQFCRLNLGELSVQSQVGKGSTFSFSIPYADPKEVIRRWLNLRAANRESLRAIEITVEEDESPSAVNEADCFFNCLLRQDDLLLRTAPHQWWLVMEVPVSEASTWFERTEEEFARANRNRPFGPLPRYQAESRLLWDGQAENDLIVKQFGAAIRNKRVAAVTT